ncbi:serine proteinase stubble-like isoform X2 [Leptidea sinapis]|uniref:serine proteinase stubble-like isoform X2 n=1 Tax=Leptidea sinapis TaxID=189913 RepID=UPI0021C26FA2|nr:serine proteinase stubble-like isoform X2 [Leptidea sinapis]
MGPPINLWPSHRPTYGANTLESVVNRLRGVVQVGVLLLVVQVLLGYCGVTAGPVLVSLDYLQGPVPLARNIRHLPCVSRRSGEEGLCMFAIDCLKANGSHLGTCIDRFYFGSCCQIPDKTILPQIISNNIDDNSIDSSNFVHPQTDDKIPDVPNINKNELKPERQTTTPRSTENPTITSRSTESSATDSKSTESLIEVSSSTESAAVNSTESAQDNTEPNEISKFDTTIIDNKIDEATNLVTKETTEFAKTTEIPIKLSTFQTVSGDTSNLIFDKHETTIRPDKLETTTSTERPKPTRKPVKPTYKPRPTYRPTNFTRPQYTGTGKPRPTKPITSFNATRKPPYRLPPKRPSTKRPVPIPPRLNITILPQITSKPVFTRPSVPIITFINSTVSKTEEDKVSSLSFSTEAIVSTVALTTAASTTTTSTTPIPTTKPPKTTISTTTTTTTTSTTTPQPTTTTTTTTTTTSTTPQPTTTKTTTSTTPQPTTTKTTTSTTPQPTTTKTTTSTTPQPTTTTTTHAPATTLSTTVASTELTEIEEAEIELTEKVTQNIKLPESTLIEFVGETTKATITLDVTENINETTLDDTKNEIEITTEYPPFVTWSNTVDTVTKTPEATKLPEITTTEAVKPPETTTTEATKTPEATTTLKEELWSPITPPEGWVLISTIPPKPETTTESIPEPQAETTIPQLTPSPTTETTTTTSKPPEQTTSTTETTKPSTEQIVEFTVNVTLSPTVPTTTTSIGLTSEGSNGTTGLTEEQSSDNKTDATTPATTTTTESYNMSNYKEVCGRRMWPQGRIVGGAKSGFGQWPWQISLRQYRTSTYLHKCGAALLNENWAITAAHCVEHVPPSELLVRLGEHDLANEEEPYGFAERRVQIIASHPHFDPATFEYDLALLRFYEPVTFQPNILPVCVPDDDDDFVGRTAHVTGWGRLYDEGPLPSVLQEVEVPVINNTACEAMYQAAGYNEHIPNIFICAGWKKGGSDSCEGDSGGPMVIERTRDNRYVLGGIISWGIGCAEPNQPGVYTRISEFRDWINQILQF